MTRYRWSPGVTYIYYYYDPDNFIVLPIEVIRSQAVWVDYRIRYHADDEWIMWEPGQDFSVKKSTL